MRPARALVSDDLIDAELPNVLGVFGATGTGKTVLLRQAVSSWVSTGRPATVIDSSYNFRGIPGADVTELPWSSDQDNRLATASALRAVSPSADLLLVIDDPNWAIDDAPLLALMARVVASVRAASGRVLVAANAPACLSALGTVDDLVLLRLHRDDGASLGIPDEALQALERARIGHGLPYDAFLRG